MHGSTSATQNRHLILRDWQILPDSRFHEVRKYVLGDLIAILTTDQLTKSSFAFAMDENLNVIDSTKARNNVKLHVLMSFPLSIELPLVQTKSMKQFETLKGI